MLAVCGGPARGTKMKLVQTDSDWTGAGTDKGLFLAGGISNCTDWRKILLDMLKETDLTILNPRRDVWAGTLDEEYEQVSWEYSHMMRADAILFWFPKESVCPIALFELGAWLWRPKKKFIGIEPGYPKEANLMAQISLENSATCAARTLDGLAERVKTWAR